MYRPKKFMNDFINFLFLKTYVNVSLFPSKNNFWKKKKFEVISNKIIIFLLN